MFRFGLENLTILQPRREPAPWLLIAAPNLVGSIDSDVYISNLPKDRGVILELNVLRHQPQPNWPQLIKVITKVTFSTTLLIIQHCYIATYLHYLLKKDSN